MMDGAMVPVPQDDDTPIPLNKSLVVVAEGAVAITEPKKRGRPKKHVPPPHEGSNSAAMAQRYIDRLVHLLEEKQEISAGIADLKLEMKGQGFIPKVIARLAAEAMETADEAAAREAEKEDYDRLRVALGQLAGTPLGDAAHS